MRNLPDDRDRTAPTVALGEIRYRLLLGAEAWQRLKPAVQKRFSTHLGDGESVVYVGLIRETRMSRAGWLLAQICRIVGGPLPIERGGQGLPAIVTVTEDRHGKGQFWTRLYGRRRGFPQVIHSAKCFAGPTGLEEYIGFGLGIALNVQARGGALIFSSAGYFLKLLGRRLPVPAWLSPGNLEVGHHDCGGGRFAFTLDLTHPLLGSLIRQTALFCDTKEIKP